MQTEMTGAGECPFATPAGRVRQVDPPPELARLSVEQPICQVRLLNGETGWLVTSYELGRAVLTGKRFSARRVYGRQPFGELDRWLAEGRAEAGKVPFINEIDPPDHTRRRRAITGQLSLQRAQDHRDAVQKIIDDHLDAMEAAGAPVDFMEMFARPVPALVLCELFGIPGEDREIFVHLTDRIRDPEVSADEIGPDIEAFYTYVEKVVAGKRQNPGDDLLSQLIRTGELTPDELVKDAIGVLQAGHETTTVQFGYTLFALLSERELWEALKADLDSVGKVVEEALRYFTIIDANPTERTALEDIQLGGCLVEAGQTVVVSALAANRDPNRFPDPDRFDPARDARGHLAFGFGIHMCAGQHVARLELKLGLTALARRFPNLALGARPEEMRWLAEIHQLSGPLTLPVVW